MAEWGDLIEGAMASEHLSRAQVESYLTHAIAVELIAPARLREGDSSMVAIAVSPDRVGSSPSIEIAMAVPPVVTAGVALIEGTAGPSRFWLHGRSSRTSFGQTAVFEREPGEHTLECTAELEVRVRGGRGAAADAVVLRHELCAETEVVPRGTSEPLSTAWTVRSGESRWSSRMCP